MITERGWLVRTLMRIAWKASQSSGVKIVASDGYSTVTGKRYKVSPSDPYRKVQMYHLKLGGTAENIRPKYIERYA